MDSQRQIHILLVGRHRHLCRFNAVLKVATVQIERTNVLEICCELVLCVQIVLRVPAEPVRRGELHFVMQGAVAKCRVADEFDLTNPGTRPFDDREQDRNTIPVDRRNCRCDFGVVVSASEVLPFQLLLRLVHQRPVVHASVRQPDRVQCLRQVILVEFVDPCEVD